MTDTVNYPSTNGAVAKYTYYPNNRVDTITHTDSVQAVISSFDYLYDPNGNRTEQIEVQGGVTETTNYVYDGLDRLENFTLTSGADVTVTSYTFEGYNRKTETVTVNAATTVAKTSSYDETNWLTDLTDTVPAIPVVITYQYDNSGNTLLKTDSSKPGEDVLFDYDVANRMVQTTQGVTQLGQYDYNAQGMRVRHYGSERGDVDYFYDGGSVLEEFVTGASGGLLAHYRYGDRLLSLDNPTDGVQYYHHDGLGSTVNLTDSAGATKVSYQLDPWGHIRNQIGSSVNRQVFTGQEHDEKTGLIYFGARYYDPDTARFMSQDSYLGEAGTPPSLHRYLYAYSNPTVYMDLMGYASLSTEYMDKVDQNLAEGNTATAFGWFALKQIHNGLTFGFLDSHDSYYDKYERGEIDGAEYALRTTAAAGKSAAVGVAVVATAGAAGSGAAVLTTELGAGAVTTALVSGAAAGAAAGGTGLAVSDVYDVAAGGDAHSAQDYAVAIGGGAILGTAASGVGIAAPLVAKAVQPAFNAAKEKITSAAARMANGVRSAASAVAEGRVSVSQGLGSFPGNVKVSVQAKTGNITNSVNGNSMRSVKAQHGYEIVDTHTWKVAKTGVSGGKLNKNGSSRRANAQANKWNKETGNEGRYQPNVVKQIPEGPGARQEILKWEQQNASRLRRELDPARHSRP